MDIAAAIAQPGTRLMINCHACGISRVLPEDLTIGQEFVLKSCGKCHAWPLLLRLTAEGVEEVV